MSKIQTIRIENIQAISSCYADFKGCTAIITGANNKGKTTLVRALMDRLRIGKPDMVLHKNADGTIAKEGYCEMTLTTGEKLIWSIDSTKKTQEKLTFISERNIKSSLTKEIASYYFPKIFDVDDFLSEIPSKQVVMIEKISGIDFSDFNQRYKAAMEERTYATSVLNVAKAKEVLFEPHWTNELQDISITEKELYTIDNHNERYKTVQERLALKKQSLKDNSLQIERLEQRLKEIKAEIEQLESNNMQLETDIDKGENWLKEDIYKPKGEEEKKKLQEKIADIRLNNSAIEAKLQLQKAEDNFKISDEEVKRLKAERIDTLKSSNFPEEFTFDEDGVFYKGLPFNRKSLSSSAIYIGALKLAALGLGDVKCLHFDASFLDKNSLMEIEEWANLQGLQLLIERPDFEGGEIKYEIIEQKNNQNEQQEQQA